MHVLITGGAGFVGSHLADFFMGDGHYVTAVDNLITGSRANIEHLLDNERFEFMEHDVTVPFDVDRPLDAIFHLASTASPPLYLKYPIETLRAGSYGTHNTLELALKHDARFLLASTSEVYGDPQIHPQPETYNGNVSSVGPRSVYDESKRYAEAVTMAYHTTYGAKTRIVRIFNTYGPRMNLEDGRVVPNFLKQAILGDPITIYGDGHQTRCFQYVDDLVEGMVRLIHSDYTLPVNIGTSREISIRQFAEIVQKVMDNKCEVVFQPENRVQDDPQIRKPDISRALEVLDWQPKVPLEEGLVKTLNYFREILTDTIKEKNL